MGIFGRRRRSRPDAPQDAWPPETLPDGLEDLPLPAGADNGDHWIYEIDGEYSSETWAPPESIRRWWLVDRDGNVVGESVENPKFGPPQDDLRRVTDPDGPLSWLPHPEATVRGWLTVALGRVAEGIEVHWLKVKDDPLVLGGNDASDFGRPDFDSPPPPRIGVAVPVGLGVQLAGHSPTVLWGLLLWVLVADDPAADPKNNVWFRSEVDADRADELLRIVLQAPDIRF
jgi:hypothetical protein